MKCYHELWFNKNSKLVLCPHPNRHWYLKYYDRTHWITGIDLYWLISNGYKKMSVVKNEV